MKNNTKEINKMKAYIECLENECLRLHVMNPNTELVRLRLENTALKDELWQRNLKGRC